MTDTAPAAAKTAVMKPQTPSVGRVVHYVLPAPSPHAGEHRAATVAQCFSDAPGGDINHCNLTVSKGQMNDFDGVEGVISHGRDSSPVVLVSSVSHDSSGAPGTWHWPEPVV